MSRIDNLRNLGDDAYQTFWSIVIPPFLGATFNEDLLFRVQNTSIPSSGHDTYDVHYKGQRVPKTSALDPSEKEITFTFRADKNMLIYKALKAWKNLVYNTNTGTIGASEIVSVPMVINLEDSEENIISIWTLQGARVKTMGDIPLDYTSGDPLTIDVTIVCDLIDDTLA